jgi:transmembrane sensor
MNPGTERLYQLLDQYRQDKLTAHEADELQALLKAEWIAAPADSTVPELDWEAMYVKIITAGNRPAPVVSIMHKSISKWVAAAILILVVASASWFIILGKKQSKSSEVTAHVRNDFAPGGFKARLTLADGTVITLDSVKAGQLAKQGNTTIVNHGKELVYQQIDPGASASAYNTLATSNGQSYSLTLSDGTKVWLNAASSIRFPVAFTAGERKVQVSGEVYFEVAHNASKPFKVAILGEGNNPDGQQAGEVEVLGTHFNINAYPDEDDLKVTLLEGSVKFSAPINKQLNNSIILKPGQQGVLSLIEGTKGGLGALQTINVEDIDGIVAWKENKFYFNSTDIHTIMRQLARWYNVEVVYQDNITNHFTGMISRSVNASEVFSMLKQTGTLNISIEGRKVTISK